MSSDLLSQDEIDALLSGVDSGSVDTAPLPAPAKVRPYDLTSEDKIARSRLPALEMINERFARTWRVGLYNLLRRSVDLKVHPVETIRFGEYTNQLKIPTNLNMVQIKPLRGVALIMCEPSLVFGVVDHFFGGAGKYPTNFSQREFTPSEMRVIQLLLKQTFADLTEAWSPIMPIEPEHLHSEVNPHFANVVAPREYVVVSRFDVALESGSGSFHIVYPFAMLDPIREMLDSGMTRPPSEQGDDSWRGKLREQLKEAEVELSSAIAERQISLRELSRMKVGDVIPLNVQENVTLKVEQVPVFTGVFGTHNKRNAIKISSVKRPAESSSDTTEPSDA